jgi:UDP-glucuronate 4-epimerase
MAIAKFARLLLRGEKVPLYGDGQTARDYTYIADVLDGVVAAIERTAHPVEPFRVYNLGGAHTTSLRTLLGLLESSLGRRADILWLGEQPGDVPLTFADTARAAAELGYAPKITIEEGIRRYCDWLTRRPLFA